MTRRSRLTALDLGPDDRLEPEIEAYFTQYGVGILTPGTTADDLVHTLRGLTTDAVVALKNASDSSAAALSSASDRETQRAVITRLISTR